MQVEKPIAFHIENWLQSAWYKPSLLSNLSQIILWPLSLAYRFLAYSHKSLYRLGICKTHKVRIPVIVVGNIVAGGAGKTPTVIALVQHLQAQGIKVGVISRGYGRTSQVCQEVKKTSTSAEVGDEPAVILLACQVPIFVAKKRFEAASALLKAFPYTDIIISDDGLQHHALKCNIAITVFDDRGIGNGKLLPAGPLRETPSRALSSLKSLVLHTGNDSQNATSQLGDIIAPQFTAHRALASYALRADGSQVNLNDILATNKKPLLALAGIANPSGFFTMLRSQGFKLAETIALPDHYEFDTSVINKYAFLSSQYCILCTVKDAVKLWRIAPEALAIPLVFTPEAAFYTAFDQRLKPLLKPQLTPYR